MLLMAVGRISSLADMLVKEKAYPLDVPVAVIENATCPGVREKCVGGMARKDAHSCSHDGLSVGGHWAVLTTPRSALHQCLRKSIHVQSLLRVLSSRPVSVPYWVARISWCNRSQSSARTRCRGITGKIQSGSVRHAFWSTCLFAAGRREVRGVLSDIGDIVQAEGIQAPAVVVIGRTVSVLS